MLETVQTSSFYNNLQNAWFLRWNQHIEDSMEALAKLQVQQGWEQLEVDSLQSSQDNLEFYIETLLLKGSIMRAQGFHQKSSAWLKKIYAKNSELQLPQNFRLLFELGLDSWRQEDTAKALEHFLLAERKTRNIIEQCFTVSNILWCLENLDLKRSKYEEKLADALQRVPQDQQHLILHVTEQFKTYQLRKIFYKTGSLPQETHSGQAVFFQQWVQRLPYSVTEQNADFLESSYLWQGSYRRRTLAGIWSPSDRNNVRTSDAIDRLYLWIWQWMQDQAINKEKVLWTLDSILQQLELSELSKENALLLRNSCAWLARLDCAFEKKMAGLLKKLHGIIAENYSLLEAEYILISCLSQSGASDIKEILKEYSVFELIFRQSQGECKNPFLPRLQNHMRSKFNLINKSAELVIDKSLNEIRFAKSETLIKSAKMISLIEEIHTQKFVRIEDLLNDFSDSRAVHNMLSRLRRHLDVQSIVSENGRISKGPNWPSISVVSKDEASHFEDLTSFVSSRTQVVGSDAYLQAAKAILPKVFTRKEMEKNLKISKATACRMLEEWLEKDLLIKSGKARAVTYQWETHE